MDIDIDGRRELGRMDMVSIYIYLSESYIYKCVKERKKVTSECLKKRNEKRNVWMPESKYLSFFYQAYGRFDMFNA